MTRAFPDPLSGRSPRDVLGRDFSSVRLAVQPVGVVAIVAL